jgi:hypothetical protein
LLPTFDSGEDAAWISGPDERFGIGIGFGDEAVDGSLELFDGSEDTALKPLTREFGEEGFHGVEPGCRGRSEVKSPTRMQSKPCAHLGMFVSDIVIDDGVDSLSLGHLRLDGIEKANELLMAMALHVASHNRAVEHVERGEQRGGAVTFVVVRHGTGAARLPRGRPRVPAGRHRGRQCP